MSKLKHTSPAVLVNQLMASIRTHRAERGNTIEASWAGKVASLESLDNVNDIAELTHEAQEVEGALSDTLNDALATNGADNSDGKYAAGLEAASIIMMASAGLSQYATAPRKGVGIEGLNVFDAPPSGSAGSISYVPSVEAFDPANIEKYAEASVTYNLLAPRQDAMGELFYPTIVGTPDQAMFKATIDRTMVYTGAVHKLNGDITRFNKKHLLEAFRDASILRNDATKLVPVAAADDSNAQHFVDDALVPTYNVVVDGVDIPTRPLKFDNRAGVLGLSSHPGLVAAGLLDQSDAVDHNAFVSALYATVSDGTDTKVVRFNTARLPLNQFVKASQGHGKDTALAFRTAALKLDGSVKDLVGDDVPALAALASNNLTLRLRTEVFGTLNLERGDLKVNKPGVEFFQLLDENGAELGLDHTALENLAIEFIGFDLDARRTNSNRRSRGLLLDADRWEEVYHVGLLPPMSIQKPTSPYEQGADVQGLINATHVTVSNAAVTTALNYAESLKAYVESSLAGTSTADSETGGEIEGIGRMLVTAHYEHHEVDLEAVVNSISSKDVLKDVQGYFVAMISEIGYRMLQVTGYRPAIEVLSGGTAKPKLIIGTDNYLPAFMMLQGDDRTAGISMDYEIASSHDSRMYGKILISFGQSGDGFRPLNFGNMLWIPELVSSIPVNRSGATVEETMVQPRFRHINNLPILAEIDVRNLDKFVQDKTSILFQNVNP